jgi:hypothetical protein
MATPSLYDLGEGDIGAVIDLTMLDPTLVPIDVSSATALTLYWQHGRGPVAAKTPVAIQNGPGGVFRYTTVASDVARGDLRLEVEFTLASGWTGRSDPVTLKVKSNLAQGM